MWSWWIWILDSTHKHLSLSAAMAVSGCSPQLLLSCTHSWQQHTHSLSYACPQMWGCCQENERRTSLHILLSPPHRLNRPLIGAHENKFSPLRERQGVKQKHDKSSPQAERYPTSSSKYLSPFQACMKASTRTGWIIAYWKANNIHGS